MLICASNEYYNRLETFNTLQFGSRASTVENKPLKNVQLSLDEIKLQLVESKNNYDKLNCEQKMLNNNYNKLINLYNKAKSMLSCDNLEKMNII